MQKQGPDGDQAFAAPMHVTMRGHKARIADAVVIHKDDNLSPCSGNTGVLSRRLALVGLAHPAERMRRHVGPQKLFGVIRATVNHHRNLELFARKRLRRQTGEAAFQGLPSVVCGYNDGNFHGDVRSVRFIGAASLL
jgi:hypothetical protein